VGDRFTVRNFPEFCATKNFITVLVKVLRAHPEPDIPNTIRKIMPFPEEPISTLSYHLCLHLQSDRFVSVSPTETFYAFIYFLSPI
jgi:hypothetical protein